MDVNYKTSPKWMLRIAPHVRVLKHTVKCNRISINEYLFVQPSCTLPGGTNAPDYLTLVADGTYPSSGHSPYTSSNFNNMKNGPGQENDQVWGSPVNSN